MRISRTASPARTIELILALLFIGRPAGAAAVGSVSRGRTYTILYLTQTRGFSGSPGALEWTLNEAGRLPPYVVVQDAGDGPDSLARALDRYRPESVVSTRPLPENRGISS